MKLNGKTGAVLRLSLVVLVVGSLLATSGCSWFRRGKKSAKLGADAGLLDQSGTAPGVTGGDGSQPNSPIDEGRVTGERRPFPAGAMNVIYFDYNQSQIRPDQTASLDANVAYLKQHDKDKVFIEGNTDERGTTEYNFALGSRRAEAIQAYFIQRGIAADRVSVGSKGEEQPAVPGHNEAAFAKNRRCEFYQVD
jgi:peptidoglycan-associated lipoprotein